MFLRGKKHMRIYRKWLIPILGTAKNAEKSYIFVILNLKKNTTLGKKLLCIAISFILAQTIYCKRMRKYNYTYQNKIEQ